MLGERGWSRRREPQDLLRQQYQPGVHADEQPGDDRLDQGPAQDPVDVVQAVLQDGHAHAHGHREEGGQDRDVTEHAPEAGRVPERDPDGSRGLTGAGWSRTVLMLITCRAP